MEVLIKLLDGIWFVPFVAAIMFLTNLVNTKGYFVPFYKFLERKIKSPCIIPFATSVTRIIHTIFGRSSRF